MLKKTLISTLICALLASCSSAPLKRVDAPKDLSPTDEKGAGELMNKQWNDVAVEREGRPSIVLMTPFLPPEELRAKKVRIELDPGATVRDVVAMLGNLGYSVVIADKDAGDKDFYMPKYSGSVGGLLAAVQNAADVWFTWQDGVLSVSSKERITVSLPQDEGLSKKVKDGLTSLGVDPKLISWEAGMVSVDLKPSQLSRFKAYLERMTQNAGMVTLQVAVITVALNQNDQQGIDWNKFSLVLGKNGPNAIYNNTIPNGASTTGTTTPTTTTGTTGAASTGSVATVTGANGETLIAQAIPTPNISAGLATGLDAGLLNTFGMTAGGLQTAIGMGAFNLAGFINILGTYGSTDTLQNVMLKTITGNKVELKSVTKIPYVSSVGVSNLGGVAPTTTSTSTAGTTTTSGGGNLMGSTKTATANDGITMALTPSYDASSNTVTLELKMSIEAVVSFNNLSAGNQIGGLSQPTTAERSFNDILRVRPGQTVVVGGVTYDSVTRSDTSPLALRDTSWDNRSLKVTKTSMFIVIRPTVSSLGSLQQEPDQGLMPRAAMPKTPAESLSSAPVKHVPAKTRRSLPPLPAPADQDFDKAFTPIKKD